MENKPFKVSIPKLHSIKFKTGPLADNVEYPVEFPRPEILPAINVLQGAIENNLVGVVLIGYQKDGKEYIAGSYSCFKKSAYLFGRGQLDMLRRGDL